MMNKQIKFGDLLYAVAALSLAGVFVFFILEKTQITNLYSKRLPNPIADVRHVNDISYTPADPQDNAETNQNKSEDKFGNSPVAPEPGAPVQVVLTAATQDEPGGPVVVRVLLTDVTTGTCTISLTKGVTKKEYVKNIVNAGTYYNCEALDIPISDLSAGDWNLEVKVTSGDRTGVVNQVVKVTKP